MYTSPIDVPSNTMFPRLFSSIHVISDEKSSTLIIIADNKFYSDIIFLSRKF